MSLAACSTVLPSVDRDPAGTSFRSPAMSAPPTADEPKRAEIARNIDQRQVYSVSMLSGLNALDCAINLRVHLP
jgi:hypothetical protein